MGAIKKALNLEELMKDAEIIPMVNQVEFTQAELIEFCKENNIQLTAWISLM